MLALSVSDLAAFISRWHLQALIPPRLNVDPEHSSAACPLSPGPTGVLEMPSWNILKAFLVLSSSLSSMPGSTLSSGWKVLVCGTPVCEQCQENEKARKLEGRTSDAGFRDA